LNGFSGNWVFDHTMDFIASHNFLKGTLPIAIYWFWWFNRSPNQQHNRVLLIRGILAALLAVIMARGLAHLLPVQQRPFVDASSGFVSFLTPSAKEYENWSSFPSDTAAFSFALACALVPISRRFGYGLLVLSAVPACLIRVYIGLHYPSDIAVGAAMGILAVWIMQKVPVPQLLAHSGIIKGTGNHPWFYCIAFAITSEMAQVFDNVRDARAFGKELLPHLQDAGGMTGLIMVGVIGLVFLAFAVAILHGGTRMLPNKRISA
jgi:undecaprenyl-diphosphatase